MCNYEIQWEGGIFYKINKIKPLKVFVYFLCQTRAFPTPYPDITISYAKIYSKAIFLEHMSLDWLFSWVIEAKYSLDTCVVIIIGMPWYRLEAVERLHVTPFSQHLFKDTCWEFCLLVFQH